MNSVAQTTPRFSVIIPTYQRRDVVVESVRALARQDFDGAFEVIVVVDGSTDGTSSSLRALRLPFPLKVLEQTNQGASRARNRGADAAGGEILLFLDDDMESHPRLLAEHDRSHRAGADVVLGQMPLHPDSPPSVLTPGVREWAERRTRRLSALGAALTLHDLLTGQMSVRREAYQKVGGFDTHFTRNGTFGNEDVDFGYRLMRHGSRIVFNVAAVSWQRYVVRPRQYLRQYQQAGHADVVFARKHPEQAATIFALSKIERPSNRLLWGPLVALSPVSAPVTGAIRWFALSRAEGGAQDVTTARWFRGAKRLEYLKGVREAGGIPRPRALRVLAYHSISERDGAGFSEPYTVTPEQFRKQIDTLLRAGYHFVSATEALRFLRGEGGLPRRPVLLTFDDCYQDLLDNALPVLQERGIPAVAFAVTGQIGGTNAWDIERGALARKLLDGDGLRELAHNGVEIGAHSRAHKRLAKLSAEELAEQVAGSVADLARRGVGRPRLFSYPYGESNEAVRHAVREAGVQAAFGVESGFVCPGCDTYQIQRIEILRGDTGWKFRWKVAVAGPLIDPRRGVRSLLPGLWQRFGPRFLQAARRRAVAFPREAMWVAKVALRQAMPVPALRRLRTMFE